MNVKKTALDIFFFKGRGVRKATVSRRIKINHRHISGYNLTSLTWIHAKNKRER